jgi:deoxyribonuclease V
MSQLHELPDNALSELQPAQARHLQERLAPRVERHDRLGKVRRLAGVDVGFEDGGATVRAAVAVLDAGDLSLVEHAIARLPTRFPYIPGLLSFRELPGVLAAMKRLSAPPDLILCDGQGLAHPRRFGIACHLGVLTDIPTIGVGKTRLTGRYQEPGPDKGDWSPMWDKSSNGEDEVIGAVLRTRKGIKPVFVSIGHRVCLQTAVDWTLQATTRYKLPETTRWAHRLASG